MVEADDDVVGVVMAVVLVVVVALLVACATEKITRILGDLFGSSRTALAELSLLTK